MRPDGVVDFPPPLDEQLLPANYWSLLESTKPFAGCAGRAIVICPPLVVTLAEFLYGSGAVEGRQVSFNTSGFLFTETARVETDNSKLKEKPDSTILAKKRYLLGPNLTDNDAAWRGKLSVTAGAEGDMEFWIPKGANLFHFVGGARFVHGGAMPQEIVVPVVTIKNIRGKSAQSTKTKPVTDIQSVTVREQFRQPRRAEEVGQPRPQRAAIQQENSIPPCAAGC